MVILGTFNIHKSFLIQNYNLSVLNVIIHVSIMYMHGRFSKIWSQFKVGSYSYIATEVQEKLAALVPYQNQFLNNTNQNDSEAVAI